MSAAPYDIAVIGGGIMGCAAALCLAQNGMRVIVLEKGDVGGGASGVNAGTLSLQIKRVNLVPYALEGHRIWKEMGAAVGFQRTGGFTLAFNQREADLLRIRMTRKRDAGVPVDFVSTAEVARREPGLTRRLAAASFCAEDGFANPSLTGRYYRARLAETGVSLREQAAVETIDTAQTSYVLRTGSETIAANRVLLACGGWLKAVAAMLDVVLPVRARVNTVSVTERAAPLIGSVIGHATGLLTMKQKPNGTVLIGGGWQGAGTPEEGRGRVALDTLLPNLRLAQFAVPALENLRVIRSWTGFESNAPDFYPLAGPLPGFDDVFVLGCVRGGYTIGPFIGRLMADFILGRQTALPLFPPDRDFKEDALVVAN